MCACIILSRGEEMLWKMYLNVGNSNEMTIFFLLSVKCEHSNARLTNFGHCVSKIQFSLVRLSFWVFVHLFVSVFFLFSYSYEFVSSYTFDETPFTFVWMQFPLSLSLSHSIENVSNKLKFSNDGAILPVEHLAEKKNKWLQNIWMFAFICSTWHHYSCTMMSFFVESTFARTWFESLCMP